MKRLLLLLLLLFGLVSVISAVCNPDEKFEVDIVFILDVSGSMADKITGVVACKSLRPPSIPVAPETLPETPPP